MALVAVDISSWTESVNITDNDSLSPFAYTRLAKDLSHNPSP
jgi:hypothetical protein